MIKILSFWTVEVKKIQLCYTKTDRDILFFSLESEFYELKTKKNEIVQFNFKIFKMLC